MMKKFSGKTMLIFGALLVGLVLGGTAIAVGGTPLSPSPEGEKVTSTNSSIETTAQTPVGGNPDEALAIVRGNLGALRSAAAKSDAPTEAILQSGIGRNVIAASAVRRVGATKSGTTLFAVPVYGGGELPSKEPNVCLVESNAAGTCTPKSGIARGESILYADHLPELGKGEARLVGLVPDGVSEVTVSLSNGETLTLPVSNNLYSHEGNFTPKAVSWTVNGSKVTRSVPGA